MFNDSHKFNITCGCEHACQYNQGSDETCRLVMRRMYWPLDKPQTFRVLTLCNGELLLCSKFLCKWELLSLFQVVVVVVLCFKRIYSLLNSLRKEFMSRVVSTLHQDHVIIDFRWTFLCISSIMDYPYQASHLNRPVILTGHLNRPVILAGQSSCSSGQHQIKSVRWIHT